MIFRLCLLLGSVGSILGQGSSERYDILRGTKGESACTLQDNVANCALLTRRNPPSSSILGRDDTSPVPSTCTCNTIFFNIWSACRYSTGNNTLPNLTEWAQECTQSGKQIDSSSDLSLGVDVPSWATLAVPGNTSFDLQRAVVRSLPIQWTPLQRMLPVGTAVITLLISGIVLLMCRRTGGRTPGWKKGMKRLQSHGSHKVTTSFDKGDDWKIDQEDDPPIKEQLFVNFAPSVEEEEIFHGKQARIPPAVNDPEPTDVHGSDKRSKTILNSTSEKILMGAHPFKIPPRPSVRAPWKRRPPPQIRLVPATSRFRVDSDADKSICSGEAGTGNGFGVNGEQPVDDQYVSPEDEEEMNLITPTTERNSQEVLLISKDGRPFTIESRSTNTVSVNSHIKIISPSVSSISRSSAVNAVVPPKPMLHIPISPPPSHPAPAPPIMPRRTERPDSSGRGQPLAYFLPPSFLPPIREASPTQLYSSSSLRRSPAVIRRSSNSESIRSIRTSPAAQSTPDLCTTNTRLPPDYFELRRTESQCSDFSLASNAEFEELLYDPYLDITATRNRRGNRLLTEDGSDESFYCTSPEPPQMQPMRVASPSTTDPAAFFPGAVRGAGYLNPRPYT